MYHGDNGNKLSLCIHTREFLTVPAFRLFAQSLYVFLQFSGILQIFVLRYQIQYLFLSCNKVLRQVFNNICNSKTELLPRQSSHRQIINH